MVTSSFPFPIQEVQTDRGTEFRYVFMSHVLKRHPFELALAEAGIGHKLPPLEDCLPPAADRTSDSHV